MSEITDESPFEDRAEQIFSFVFGGIHNAPKITKTEGWWSCCTSSLATYDFNNLTRLVLAAHKYAVRAEIQNGGPRRIKILLHPRKRNAAHTYARHPSIETAIGSLPL